MFTSKDNGKGKGKSRFKDNHTPVGFYWGIKKGMKKQTIRTNPFLAKISREIGLQLKFATSELVKIGLDPRYVKKPGQLNEVVTDETNAMSANAKAQDNAEPGYFAKVWGLKSFFSFGQVVLRNDFQFHLIQFNQAMNTLVKEVPNDASEKEQLEFIFDQLNSAERNLNGLQTFLDESFAEYLFNWDKKSTQDPITDAQNRLRTMKQTLKKDYENYVKPVTPVTPESKQQKKFTDVIQQISAKNKNRI